MWDTYSQQIYQWLQNSGLDDVIDKLDSLIGLATDLLQVVVLFGLVFLGYKFLSRGFFRL